ncbi:NUDIX domain-containing protein [Psychrobacillus sp. INOP01]|uniref:NUDIX hydrolase n=1 Tax=Psychrobacillus sp. INOP01 TaxID=2829187 RepID=UPI001BAC8897|nr:NUDIX domain-containing protein [Psychrobacillus sp. INOP01]QUG40367.1 NUDIX domain-containing protein [Psychrobacillus sp. INOP01]
MFIVNVEGAIYKNEKWLLVRRSEKEDHAAGLLSLVGGKVEIDGITSNILEETLKREITEEVGIEVSNLKYVNSSLFETDTGLTVIDIVFLCEHQSGEPYAKCLDEVSDIFWMSTQEILDVADLPVYLKENIKLADKILHGN